MKTSKILQACDDYSRQTSDNVRTLSLAGFGAIWILAGENVGGLHLRQLLLPMVPLAAALVLDLLQNWWGAYRYQLIADGPCATAAEQEELRRSKAGENLDGIDPDVEVPSWLLPALDVIFHAKMFALMAAYIFIAWAIGTRLA